MKNTPKLTPTDSQPTDEQVAHDGTPEYGDFGHPVDANAPRRHKAPASNAANDNPDEPSEGPGPDAAPAGHNTAPNLQRGHVEQNQDTAAIVAAHGGGDAEEHAAYALDDPRYAGGDVYDLKNEQTSL